MTAYYVPKPEDNYYANCRFKTIPVFAEELNHLNEDDETFLNLIKRGYEVDYLYSAPCFTCQDKGWICGSSEGKKFVCVPKHHNSGN